MAMNEQKYDFKWSRRQCVVRDDTLIEALPPSKMDILKYFYYPFDSPNIYLEFITINENNYNEIKCFVEKYGFLYNVFDHYKETPPWDGIPDIDALGCESIPLIQLEIKKFRNLVNIYSFLKNDFINLEELIKNTFEQIKDTSIYLNISHFSSIESHKNSIKLEFTILFTRKLNDILRTAAPRIELDSFTDGTFDLKWHVNDLITAMYIMFMNDITKNKDVKLCSNKTCSQYFVIYGNDDRKEYCSNSCARAQAQREYRKRIKEKKESD